MNDTNDVNIGIMKIMVAWIGNAVGGMSFSSLLSILVLSTTLLFTLLQIFVIVRNIWRGTT